MQYEKEIVLKDGTECLLRGASEADAAEVLRIFGLTHAETDYLLTYPEENSFTVEQEAEFLKERSKGKNAIEIAAFVDGRIAGTAEVCNENSLDAAFCRQRHERARRLQAAISFQEVGTVTE